MAKYEVPFEDTQALYNKHITNAELGNCNVNITIVTNNRAKDIFKVTKASDLLKYRAGDDVLIVINEKILLELTPEQQSIVVEESLASIHYDKENSVLVINKPDVVTFSGLIRKHGFENWNTLRESIKTLYAAEKQAEDEAKALTEKAKKNKKHFAN
jgi:hypothetical protein